MLSKKVGIWSRECDFRNQQRSIFSGGTRAGFGPTSPTETYSAGRVWSIEVVLLWILKRFRLWFGFGLVSAVLALFCASLGRTMLALCWVFLCTLVGPCLSTI